MREKFAKYEETPDGAHQIFIKSPTLYLKLKIGEFFILWSTPGNVSRSGVWGTDNGYQCWSLVMWWRAVDHYLIVMSDCHLHMRHDNFIFYACALPRVPSFVAGSLDGPLSVGSGDEVSCPALHLFMPGLNFAFCVRREKMCSCSKKRRAHKLAQTFSVGGFLELIDTW